MPSPRRSTSRRCKQVRRPVSRNVGGQPAPLERTPSGHGPQAALPAPPCICSAPPSGPTTPGSGGRPRRPCRRPAASAGCWTGCDAGESTPLPGLRTPRCSCPRSWPSRSPPTSHPLGGDPPLRAPRRSPPPVVVGDNNLGLVSVHLQEGVVVHRLLARRGGRTMPHTASLPLRSAGLPLVQERTQR